ncbi:MAG: GntR family transcriptional regulator [Treponema sp.]|jgi:GntR family transcriptional regulator of gluconate operon|nr:GntR family transcriptional regulator [Treponema sp.]
MNVDELYRDIKAKILREQFTYGQRLVETGIAKSYGVSRLYVKSVFQRLEAEKLVEHIRNKGYFVCRTFDSLIEEIADMRQALEGVIIRRVIRSATPEQFGELSRILERITVFIRNGMINDGLDEVEKFYKHLFQISGYRRVVAILDTYSDYIAIIRKRSARTQDEHLEYLENLTAMLNAMIAGDEKIALHQIELRHKYLFSGMDIRVNNH